MKILNNNMSFSANVNKTEEAVAIGKNLQPKARAALEAVIGRAVLDERDIRVDLYTKKRGDIKVLRVNTANNRDSKATGDICNETRKPELLQWYENAVRFLTNSFG